MNDGLCGCGCGGVTTVWRGVHRRYLPSHHLRVANPHKPAPQATPLELIDRAARRSFEDPNGCWVFTGALSQGYGRVGHKRQTWLLHRLAYAAMVEDVGPDLTLDHLCRNRACWNPDHLEPVPIGVNVSRALSPNRAAFRGGECRRGHDITDPHNVYDYNGRRQCAECARENARRRRAVA